MPWGTPGMAGFRKLWIYGLLMAAVTAVSGCSAGDVQLEGKIFELAGLNNITKKSATPKMAARTGLVVPPDLNRLPDPNQPVVAANPSDDVLASINDPDRAREVDEAELKRQQAVACKDYELAEQRGDPDAASMSGPLGPCRASILTSLGKYMGGQ